LFIVLALDIVLAVSKGLYGYYIGSLGMVSDGLHSMLHASGGIIGIIGVSLAAHPPDADHPYGYERYEPLASMGIAAVMLIALWKILESAWARLETPEVPRIDAASFMVTGSALFVTIVLASWERIQARKLGSSVLRADAARMWADVLVSASVLGGLVAARFGYPRVDTLVSILVAGAISWSAWRIVRGASRVLTDAAVGDIAQISAAARSVAGVIDCHQVRARGAGGQVRVDLHITVDPMMTVAKSHAIAEAVEHRVRDRVGGVAEVLVHVGAATLHERKAQLTQLGPAELVSLHSLPQSGTLAEVRDELLSQHESLRNLATTVREIAAGLPSAPARDELSALLRAFANAMDAHNTREEALLEDVVPAIDAWGDIRAARLDEHHRQEHRRLQETVRAAAETPRFAAAVQMALPAIAELLQHMRAEEAELLNPDVLRDDLITIDQTDG
jgi:cation diffusion facilitator family transporter